MPLPLVRPALAAAALIAVGGCANYGHNGYGYSRVSAGYGSYYQPYYGWYGNYYYPGVGYYVYDHGGQRHRWNDRQRRYWEGRRDGHRDRRENWNDYRSKRFDRDRPHRPHRPRG